MKTMKKLASIVLALMMALALAVPAMAAAEKTDITLVNPQAGKSYTAYKIFDVTYNDDQSAYAYEIVTDSHFYTAVSTYPGITVTPVAGKVGVMVVTFDEKTFDAPSFAAALKKAFDAMSDDDKPVGTPLEVANGVAYAEVEKGYYFVAGTSGALCNLTNADPHATIYDKNETPTIEKETTLTDAYVEVGTDIPYTITGSVPSLVGYDTYTWKVSDTMSKGLTLKDTPVVTIGSQTLVATTDYTYESTSSTFTVALDLVALSGTYKAVVTGAEIKITYSATVNSDAVETNTVTNEATLTYSNDPADSTKTGETTPEKVEKYLAQITIVKYDGDTADVDSTTNTLVAKNPSEGITYLNGATFVLKSGEKYLIYGKDGSVQWTEEIMDAYEIKPTVTNGVAQFTVTGLKDGTYELIETVAPAGYNLLKDGVTVKVTGTGAAPIEVTSNVANFAGTELPDTGGIGTTIFTVVGGVLMVGAAVLFITKKRSAVD